MAKILVTMPDEFLNRVDGLASNEQRTRSELIREALRTYMRRTTHIRCKKLKIMPKFWMTCCGHSLFSRVKTANKNHWIGIKKIL